MCLYKDDSTDFDDFGNNDEFMKLYKLSGDHFFDEFIDFDNSASTLEEVGANQMNWKKVLCEECVESLHKTDDLHY